MATNAIRTPELSLSTAEKAYESYPPVTLKQRFEKARGVRRTRRIPWSDAGLVGFVLSLR
jgi:hypothetical protein